MLINKARIKLMAKKKQEKKVWTGMPSGTELDELKAVIESTYDLVQQIEEANGQLKDIFTELNAKNGIPKKIFNFLVKNNYYSNGYEVIKSNEEIENAYNAMQS